MKPMPGKVLYGFAFCVVLPALLFLWAAALDGKNPSLPPVRTTGPDPTSV